VNYNETEKELYWTIANIISESRFLADELVKHELYKSVLDNIHKSYFSDTIREAYWCVTNAIEN